MGFPSHTTLLHVGFYEANAYFLRHYVKGEPSCSLVLTKPTHALKVAILPTCPYSVSRCWYLSCTEAKTVSEATWLYTSEVVWRRVRSPIITSSWRFQSSTTLASGLAGSAWTGAQCVRCQWQPFMCISAVRVLFQACQLVPSSLSSLTAGGKEKVKAVGAAMGAAIWDVVYLVLRSTQHQSRSLKYMGNPITGALYYITQSVMPHECATF